MDSFPVHEMLGAVNLILTYYLIYLFFTIKCATRKAPRPYTLLDHLPLPPPPPPPPAKSENENENDAVSFRNTTKTPYIPTIKTRTGLWKTIGGDVWECTSGVHTPDNRPLGATAMLAAQFLQHHSEDTEIVREVKELLEATKSIATNCLAKKVGTDGRYFEPRVVRELQLVQYLGGTVEVEANGAACKGTLLYYTSGDFEEEHKYTLSIYLHRPVDELPVIHYSISSRSWFGGSIGIKFLERSGPV